MNVLRNLQMGTAGVLFSLYLSSCQGSVQPMSPLESINEPQNSTHIVPHRPIIIDPGHGGKDKGTTYYSITEDEFNYDISVRVKALLEKAKYTVHQTVYDSKTRYTPREKLSNNTAEYLFYGWHKKTLLSKRYLTRRCKLIDDVYPAEKNPLLVSIHVNYTEPRIVGATFYYSGIEAYGSEQTDKNSLALAQELERAFTTRRVPTASLEIHGATYDWPIPNIRDDIKEGRLAIFTMTDLTTKVLIEVGNIHNSHEQQRLTDPKRRQEISEAIFLGIVSYDQTNPF